MDWREMPVPKFEQSELEVVSVLPESPFMPAVDVFNYPVTNRQAVQAYFNRKAIWQIIGIEYQTFAPRINADNIARAFVSEAAEFDNEHNGGGQDMFGVMWEYVPAAGGSMVKPGKPLMTDANDWRNVIQFPDLDTWDWERSAAENNDIFLRSDIYNKAWLQNGFFERLISFMDFEGASIAMIDEEQTGAVKELLNAIAELYINIINKYHEHYKHIDCFYIHDDWGSQRSTFFSPAVASELLVPAMRLVTDHLHKLGYIAEFHSCGMNMVQIENIIAAGWDAWAPQPINDTAALYREYGDRILISVMPDLLSENPSEAEQISAAYAYADAFCQPGKPSAYPWDGGFMLSKPYRKALYERSRINYSR
jgi:hypothetical protein